MQAMLPRLISRKIKNAKKSIILLGPRQTGKSTLLLSLKPDLTINLADESQFIRIAADPYYFSSLIENFRYILIDEIQRIPSLLNTVQTIIDSSKNKNPILFLLSGSSARKLKRGQANLLPGRLFSYHLGGLCAQELNYHIDVRKALSVGFLPEPYLEKDKNTSIKLLETYATFYLKEEIQAESLTRNLQGFMRFLNKMAETSGSILDFSKISSKSSVSRASCIRFLEILEDTLVGSRVETFKENHHADVIKHPKFYFFDPGVLNGLLNNFVPSSDRIGKLFEHVVYSQLLNSAYALDLKIEIYYFRTRNDVEVDFIVRWKNKIYAIEVKTGNIDKSDLSGLEIFRQYYPAVHKCIAVSNKESHRMLNSIIICDLIGLVQEMEM